MDFDILDRRCYRNREYLGIMGIVDGKPATDPTLDDLITLASALRQWQKEE